MNHPDRPWPAPGAPPALRMDWCDLLFAHWPVPAAALRGLVPPALALDTFERSAWLGIVPFRMQNVRLRCWPFAFAFPELNVRTYVSMDGKPGVWFLSLDATSRLAVEIARRWYRLNYLHARISCRPEAHGVRDASERLDRRGGACALAVRYAPVGQPFAAAPGTLEHFLTARYCLYAAGRGGSVRRGEVDHVPWPLQRAEAEFARNDYAAAHGIALPATAPHLLFARELRTVAWPLSGTAPAAAS